MLAQPLMTVGERAGRRLEVSLCLQLDHARKILRASGRVPGVCYRPWANEGGGAEIATAMTWLNVPLASRGPLQEYWRKLDGCSEVSGSLAGLYWGDSLGRVGLRTWGRSPPRDLVNALATVLGADPPVTKTEVRVRGYTLAFMLPEGGYANVRRDPAFLPRVFGPQVASGIKVQSCAHPAATGLERPLFNLVLQRVPGDWQGHYIRSTDSRLPHRVWQRVAGSGNPRGRSIGRLVSGTCWCLRVLTRMAQAHQGRHRLRHQTSKARRLMLTPT